MQVANIHLRLAGDMTNEIFKPAVTVAEIAVLRAIHGADSVVNIKPLRNDKREHSGEFNRLRETYGAEVVTTVFPGSYPQLPIYFKDVGIAIDFNDDEPAEAPKRRGPKLAEAPKRRGPKAAEAAEAPAIDPVEAVADGEE